MVTEFTTFAKFPDKNRVLQLAASAEASSEHPLASAVVNFATVSQSLKILHQPAEFTVFFCFCQVWFTNHCCNIEYGGSRSESESRRC